MLRYILTYKETTCIPERPPINWDKLKYVFYRNDAFVGLFRKFNVKLEFVDNAKEFLEDIIATYGYNEEVTVTIQRYNSDNFQWETFLTGVINFGNITIKEFSIETNFENSSFEQTLMNRKSLEVAYQSSITVDGVAVVKEAFEFFEVNTAFIAPTAFVQCVYPFEAISRLIYLITGYKDRLRSSFFGKVQNGYASPGEGAYYMLTKGLYFRDFETTDVNLTFSVENLLETGLFKIFNLGMAVEVEDGISYIRIEKREYFFKQDIVLTKTNVSDLVISLNDQLFFNKIETGYEKFKEPDENSFGLQEYNTQSTYTVAHKPFKSELNIITSIRADGAQMLALFAGSGTDEKSIDGDNDIFILDCVVISGNLVSRQVEELYSYGGVYGVTPYYVNLTITPARMLYNWGNHIRTGLQFMTSQAIQIQGISGQSKVYSKTYTDAIEKKDGVNINVLDLDAPILSPFKIKFKAPLYPEDIILIEGNTDKLVKVWNNYKNEYLYGWIDEVSTDPIDKVTTWELTQAASVDAAINEPCLLDTNDNPIYNQLGGKILMANG